MRKKLTPRPTVEYCWNCSLLESQHVQGKCPLRPGEYRAKNAGGPRRTKELLEEEAQRLKAFRASQSRKIQHAIDEQIQTLLNSMTDDCLLDRLSMPDNRSDLVWDAVWTAYYWKSTHRFDQFITLVDWWKQNHPR